MKTNNKEQTSCFKIVLTLFSILVLGMIISKQSWRLDSLLGILYDKYTGQKGIWTKAGIDRGLMRFRTVTYSHLGQKARSNLGLNLPGYREIYADKEFFIIQGFDRYRYIVGNKRIKDFMAKKRSASIRTFISNHRNVEYLLIDKTVLYKTLELFDMMSVSNYDVSAIHITSGFRPPKYNHRVNGASKSRHLYGDAIDISVHDVNRDGRRNSRDVKIIYDLLDDKIIRHSGGLGKYSNYPFLIHYDTRGQKSNGLAARW